MSKILDYSVGRPGAEAIVAAGYIGVMRYVAPIPSSPEVFGGADDSAKVIFQPEYDALRAAGLAIGLNWEWYAERPREGAAAGTADAQETLRQANGLGYSQAGALYFSVDYDAPESDQPAINDYFIACAQVVGLPRLGAYAGYWVLKRLFDAGLITYGWQTVGWSGGNREGRAHLLQDTFGLFAGDADGNEVLQSNWLGGSMQPQGPFYEVTAGHNNVPTSGSAVSAAVGLTWEEIVAIKDPASGKDNSHLAPYDPNGPNLFRPSDGYGVSFLLPGFPPPAPAPAPDWQAAVVSIDATLKALLAKAPATAGGAAALAAFLQHPG